MADESPSTAALTMDRGLNLGNSEDRFLRRALHVKVSNKSSEPLPITYIETPGDEILIPARALTTPGSEQVLISQTVPANKKWFLSQVESSCSQDAVFNLYVNGGFIGAKRTGPGVLNALFIFSPRFPISSGDTIEVKVLSASYASASDADATLMVVEQ